MDNKDITDIYERYKDNLLQWFLDVLHSFLTVCETADLQVPLPEYSTMATNNIVLKLRAHEANDIFFRELSAMLRGVRATVESPALAQLASALMPAVLEETKVQLDVQQLSEACKICIAHIEDVVEEEEDELTQSARLSSNAEASTSQPQGSKGGGLEVLGQLFLANEDFRGRVKRHHIAAEIQAVERAGERVEATLAAAFKAVTEYSLLHDPKPTRPALVFDPVNSAVWIKLAKGSQAAKQAEAFELVHPHDRYGKAIADRHCTKEVEEALNEYRYACDAAHMAVRAQLKLLADTLQGWLLQMVAASTFAIIAAALEAHTHEAARRGWALPTQLHKGAGGEGQGMQVQGMWPYWLDGHAPTTVKNSFNMFSMYLLTGPNMAGKSTILRSICAVALLSGCGLYAPVHSALVPYTDAFMLRNFSADSPLEGKSSFAVEMVEMRYVMDDVTEDSLVLVDELGKGTEVRAGAAIAGAMLERLSAIQCRGIFATHLHQLVGMPLDTPNMVNMMMETEPASGVGGGGAGGQQPISAAITAQLGAPADLAHHAQQLEQRSSSARVLSKQNPDELAEFVHEVVMGFHQALSPAGMGGRVPTWRMVEGSSSESLALDVALQCQVPPEIVRRAAHLFKELEQQSQTHPSQQDVATLPNPSQVEMQSPVSIGGPTIEDAAHLLRSVAHPLLASLSSHQAGLDSASDASPEAKQAQQAQQAAQPNGNGHHAVAHSPPYGGSDEAVDADQLQIQVVRGGEVPPPSTVGCSCVYILRRGDGRFYCGQTDELKGRLNRHRKTGKVRGGGRLEAVYLVVPGEGQGQSTARAVEAQMIQALQAAGYPLISSTDARNKRVPKATKTTKTTKKLAAKAKAEPAATAEVAAAQEAEAEGAAEGVANARQEVEAAAAW
ncbi:hypothetical protein ABBQ38_007763 [Trebouxia sp. C0009 RCD-2024]